MRCARCPTPQMLYTVYMSIWHCRLLCVGLVTNEHWKESGGLGSNPQLCHFL